MGHLFFRKCSRFFSVFTIVLAFLIAILLVQTYDFVQKPLSVEKDGSVFIIRAGSSVQKIAQELSRMGIIKSTTSFLILLGWENAWSKLKSGEYLIKSGTTPLQFIQQLREGKVIQHVFTIVPGWTFERLRAELKQSPHITHTLTELSNAEIMEKLGHPTQHPEGQFFADTYHFPAGTTDLAFLRRAYDMLQKKLSEIWDTRAENLHIQSPYEALILASIIEKESDLTEEYADISGVYARRLERKMLLQADPTVIYGAGFQYTGSLTAALLAKPSAYNTYQKTGLPPTPIAFPSQGALEASVHPKAGETLYFVAKPEGKGHVFSKNLLEHQLAVTQYREALTGKP